MNREDVALTRDQMIAWLVLEGYVPTVNSGGGVWSVNGPFGVWQIYNDTKDTWEWYDAKTHRPAGLMPIEWNRIETNLLRMLVQDIERTKNGT